jgi:hypothetical protein
MFLRVRRDCGAPALAEAADEVFWNRRKSFSYVCGCCGRTVTGSPSFRIGLPPFFGHLSNEEVERRVHFDDDLRHVRQTPGVVSDDDIFTVRALLEIPIRGADEPFSWSVWVTQSRESFCHYVETAGTDQSGTTTFGWLPITLPGYRRTGDGEPAESLACDVQWQKEGLRPVITLHECDHPLFLDQRDGMTWERAIEIAEPLNRRAHGQG